MSSLDSESEAPNPKQKHRICPGPPLLSFPYFIFFSVFLFVFMLPMGFGLKAEEKPSLAILPFIVEKAEDPARGAVCSVCREIHRSSEVGPGTQNILTQMLYAKLEAVGTFGVLPSEKVEEVFSKGDRKRFETDHISSSIPLGKELNVDFVMVGILFRFEERIGSSLGVEKPASVAFDLHLFRLRDGARVWDAIFDETQKPLSEDLFQIGSFFRRGAKWLTAEELAGVGIKEVLNKLPEVKELQEKP